METSENAYKTKDPKEEVVDKEKAKIIQDKKEKKITEGVIAEKIGTGDNAKNSFIFIVIQYSFMTAALITAVLFIKALIYFNVTSKNDLDLMDDIKSIWGLFIPIITLALGYAFGKGTK